MLRTLMVSGKNAPELKKIVGVSGYIFTWQKQLIVQGTSINLIEILRFQETLVKKGWAKVTITI